MYRIKSCLFAGTSLALAIIATPAPSAAQTTKGEDGIGAGAGIHLPWSSFEEVRPCLTRQRKWTLRQRLPMMVSDKQRLRPRPIKPRPMMAQKGTMALPIRTEPASSCACACAGWSGSDHRRITQKGTPKAHVRWHVRFTPNSADESGVPGQTVRDGPGADIGTVQILEPPQLLT